MGGSFTACTVRVKPVVSDNEFSRVNTSSIEAAPVQSAPGDNISVSFSTDASTPDVSLEAVKAYESSGEAIYSMVKTALKNDFTVIITSDHGNIENDTPSHTSNDVLTTIISKKKFVCPNRKNYIVNLFDIFPTILKIMNIEPKTNQESNFSYNGSYLVK